MSLLTDKDIIELIGVVYEKEGHYPSMGRSYDPLKVREFLLAKNLQNLTDKDIIDLIGVVYGTEGHHPSLGRSYDPLKVREFLLAKQLQKLCCDNGSEIDIKETATVFHQLGQIYRERSPDKISLIRSAVLYKTAIVRKPDNVTEIEKQLRELCSHVLRLSGAKYPDARLDDKADSLLENVMEMREMVKTELESIETMEEHKFVENVGQKKKTEVIEKIYSQVSDWYSKAMSDVMNYCLLVKGNAPCEYALLGMGSLAKKEITPYSDFEHAILLEDSVEFQANFEETLEYFRWVTVIFQLVIINLGETIVPNINLPYLNNPYMKQHDWFFDTHSTRGISFDGMVPYACKFPLGRSETPKKLWKVELIKPVSQMLKYLTSEEDLKNGYHLADMLKTTCYVSGNRKVYDSFNDGVKKFVKSKPDKDSLRGQIEDDVKNFNPINGLDGISKKPKWNMKRVVYRSTTLFVEALGKIYQCFTDSTFETVRELANNKVMEDELAHDVLYAVAVALQVRLSTYFQKQRQDDWLESPTEDEQFDVRFVHLMGLTTPVKFFQTVMRLQRETCRLIGIKRSSFVQQSSSLDKLLACFWLQMRRETLHEAQKISSAKTNVEEMHIVNEVLLAVGHGWYERNSFNQALSCYQSVENWLKNKTETSEADMAHCLHRIGQCLFNLEDYNGALQYCKKELKIREQSTTGVTIDVSLAECNQLIGKVCYKLHTYDVAKAFMKKAKLFRKTNGDLSPKANDAENACFIGDCFNEQHMYNEALVHYEEAVKIRKEIVDDENTDTTLAKYCYGLGYCFLQLRTFNDAKAHLEKSKLIIETSGDKSLKPNCSFLTICIGDCSYQQKMYKEAMVHYEEAMKIRKEVVDDENTDEEYGRVCHKLGICLYQLGRFNDAKSLFERAKLILETNVNESLKSLIASAAYYIGECFNEQNMYSEALVHFEEAVKIRKAVDDESTDAIYASYFDDLGSCLYQLQRFDDAKGHFEKAKLIRETNGDESLKSNIASDACWIGECLNKLNMYKEALVHYEEAVKIKNDVVDDETTDATYAFFCHNMGVCLYQLKRFNDAKTLFERAKLINETNGDESLKSNISVGASWIGDCLYKQDMYKEALEHYEEAVKIRKEVVGDENTDAMCARYCDNMSACHFRLGIPVVAKAVFLSSNIVLETDDDSTV